MFYLVSSPWWLRLFYPHFTWQIPTDKKVVYLTFDDGPTAEITDWVLEMLHSYEAKATFFLIGKNIKEQPVLFEKLQKAGHSIGNHTYSHLNGWKNTDTDYLENLKKCDKLTSTDLFRPPYGRLKKTQAHEILKDHRIIMWDIIAGDWDKNVDGQKCFDRIRKRVHPGSIIVFHDSVKAWPRLKEALPLTLRHLAKEGYRFEKL